MDSGPDAQLPPGPPPAIVGTWGLNQGVENLSVSLPPCLSIRDLENDCSELTQGNVLRGGEDIEAFPR